MLGSCWFVSVCERREGGSGLTGQEISLLFAGSSRVGFAFSVDNLSSPDSLAITVQKNHFSLVQVLGMVVRTDKERYLAYDSMGIIGVLS